MLPFPGSVASSIHDALSTLNSQTAKITAAGNGTMPTGSAASSSAASSVSQGGLAPQTAVPVLGAAIGGGVLAIIGLL